MYNHLCITIENVLQNQNVKWQFTHDNPRYSSAKCEGPTSLKDLRFHTKLKLGK